MGSLEDGTLKGNTKDGIDGKEWGWLGVDEPIQSAMWKDGYSQISTPKAQ